MNTKSLLRQDGSLDLSDKRVVLLLQGGGAMGAYQVGAFQALVEKNVKIDWVGGVSIGALNAAIIAGSAPGEALSNLHAMWKNDILSPEYIPYDLNGWWENFPLRAYAGRLAPLWPKYWDFGWSCFNPFGQQNFYSSRVIDMSENPWFRQWWGALEQNELAFFGTDRLRCTLMRYLGGQEINTNGMALSLGTTRLTNGEVVFFNTFTSVDRQDNKWPAARVLTADHVLASCALPPAFPAIKLCDDELGEDWYWDGGLSTNTPIEALLKDLIAPPPAGRKGTVVFLVDLWDRKGRLPTSLDEVVWRQKSIQFGSRKKAAERAVEKYQLEILAGKVNTPPPTLEICQIMFERPDDDPEFVFSDADFSRKTFDTLYGFGLRDMKMALYKPGPVKAFTYDNTALYRYGTFGKHCATD